MNKKELQKMASEICKIIDESKAIFFVPKDKPNIKIKQDDILYELKATISNNVGMYFIKKLNKL